MIATRFLSPGEYRLYRSWLKSQDNITLDTYFGISASNAYIDNIVDGVLSNTDEHNFLVAYRGNKWVGVIHLARISEIDIEFGIMVHKDYRGQGIASDLMNEAVTWVCNRGFETLYLHCLRTNNQMKHLATKFGLELHNIESEVDSKTALPPPSLLTYTREAATANKNIFFMILTQTWAPFTENLG
jgi:GNAT superfamily N-acetyltransferase